MRAASVAPGSAKRSSNHWLLLGLLGLALLFLFAKSLKPDEILFANDSPLGARSAECNRLPGRFTGTWSDLCLLGGKAPAAAPSITMLVATLVSPVAFLKFYAPFTLLFLGFSAWLFFRQLNFNRMVCLLGGLAAGLNGHFFSIACWGLPQWNIAAGCSFLAMAAFYAKAVPKVWERAFLAGLAVGMGVMEGFDVGAILSVCVGLFIVFHALTAEAPMGRKVFVAVVSETVVVLIAALVAAHTMLTLVETQVEGVAAMGQDAETKATRWDAATQWSLPKVETLQVVAPGLFGYRLFGNITQKDRAGAYWGIIGQSPRVPELASDDAQVRAQAVAKLKQADSLLPALNTPDRFSRTAGMVEVTKKSGVYWRYSGTGECAGIMISLLALFAVANLWRKDIFSKSERLTVAFWGLAALFCLLAAWGRFGFLYRLLYQLPYVSTIRNPIKFMHPFHIAWLILAAYGMELLYRRYLRGAAAGNELLPQHLRLWWAKVTGFDRHWTLFLMALGALSLAAFAMLCANKHALIQYLAEQNFTRDALGPLPPRIADFCLACAGFFLIFLAASIVVLSGILSGAWSGSRAKSAWTFVGALIVVDLLRADSPWVRYYDYADRYALNPVVEFLRDKPYEHRVIGKLEPRGPGSGITSDIARLYFFWLQNDFPYHEIQTLDFAQSPHIPDLDRLYLQNFQLTGGDVYTTDLRPAARLWQLTNTRYIVGGANSVELLNTRADPIHHSFKLDGRFDLTIRPGVTELTEVGDETVVAGARGKFGIIEYPLALPRAKLYSAWQTPADDDAVLKTLLSPEFEPGDTVLISKATPLEPASSASTADAGAVQITQYHSKYVKLEADARTPSVLLLNDRYGADWRVRVDGVRSALLRCNYIMRGVYLAPGHHVVEFRFTPSLKTLYISVSAIAIGLLLAGYLIITRKSLAVPPVTPPAAAPQPPPAAASEPARPQTASPSKPSKPNGKSKRPK
jgi:AcrR family transcriptional regulator